MGVQSPPLESRRMWPVNEGLHQAHQAVACWRSAVLQQAVFGQTLDVQ